MEIVIGKLIFIVLYSGVMVAGLLFLYNNSPIPELKRELAKKEAEKQSNFNKQQYVKNNLDVFGIKDNACSDIKEIYTVSPKLMGF